MIEPYLKQFGPIVVDVRRHEDAPRVILAIGSETVAVDLALEASDAKELGDALIARAEALRRGH